MLISNIPIITPPINVSGGSHEQRLLQFIQSEDDDNDKEEEGREGEGNYMG